MHSSQEISAKSGTEHAINPALSTVTGNLAPGNASSSEYRILRRNGSVVGFEPSKISIAMTKAFLAVNGGQGAASARVRELVEQLTDNVVSALLRRQPAGGHSTRTIRWRSHQ